MYKNLAATLVAACCISLAPHGAFSQTPVPAAKPAQPLKIGFVYVTPLTPTGWVQQHDQGRLAVERALGTQVQTRYVEGVNEGADAERVIRDLAQQGNQLIVTPSFGYMEPTLKVAQEFPNVKFESITGYKTAPNVAVANARYYEGRYLAGIAAGRMSRSGIAGYVAAFPIPEVLQGINAFTLGMRTVNRQAQVKVVWLNTWYDPTLERDAAMTLMNQKADVLAYHSASDAVMAAAQERGVWAVAYHSDMRSLAPDAQLLAVTHHWGDYYTRRAQAVQNGTWTSAATWGGVKEGMVRVGDFSHKVPKKLQAEVLARQQDIAKGKLHPFYAIQAVLDNEGREVIPKGATLTDAQINQMNWLVQGVQGKIGR